MPHDRRIPGLCLYKLRTPISNTSRQTKSENFPFLRSLTHGEFSNYTISYGEKPKASPKHAVSEAVDRINDRWGEFVIIPALMLGMQDLIRDRIAFGGVNELQELYTE